MQIRILHSVFILCWILEVARGIKATWYQWGPWSKLPLSCSVTCGTGVRCRVRKCLDRFGVVQPSPYPCTNKEDKNSKPESCVKCSVNVRCPRIPGWSNWGAWSTCTPRPANMTIERGGCLVGTRTRYRRCINPPPEPPPYGIPCMGTNRDIKECFYGCSRLPDIAPSSIAKIIQLQIEADHREVRYPRQKVMRKLEGEQAKMSCSTEAYRVAKRISAAGTFNAVRKAFLQRSISIAWYRNGIEIHSSGSGFVSAVKRKFRRKSRRIDDIYMQEEIRWNQLSSRSKSQLEDTYLIIPSIREGDQGFYTCELRYRNYKWLAVFYSLIVVGIRYVAQDTDPFYLHSNLGFSNALSNAPVWLESAQIVWHLNGVERFRGLAARMTRRIQKIEHLNYTYQGTWQCFLRIPAPGTSEKMTDPLARIANTYLINEFHLKISPSAASLWQLAEYPFTIRILRNIAATLSVICLLLLLLLILTIWAARRWVTRSLSIDQKKAIVQEILDNECRLMLTARLRAAVNKERLLPLILQEHRRLELMDRYLRGLLGEQADAITPEAGAEENGIGGFSAFANKIVALGRDFRFNLGERCRKPTASPSLVQPTGENEGVGAMDVRSHLPPEVYETFSPAGTENMGPRRSERASNCRWPVDHDRINMLRSIMKSPRPNTDTESSGQPPTQNTNAPTKSTSPPARVELISPQEQKRKPAAIEKRRVVRPSTVRSQHQSLLGREGSEVKAQSQQPSQQLQYLQLPRRMNPQGQLRAKGQNVRRRSTGAAVRNIRDPS